MKKLQKKKAVHVDHMGLLQKASKRLSLEQRQAISHEINNPLTVLMLMLDRDEKRYCDLIDACDRISRAVMQLTKG